MKEPMYCLTCQMALDTLEFAGELRYQHTLTVENQPGFTPHPVYPVPLAELTNPVQFCDFCSAPAPVWVYTAVEIKHQFFSATAGYVSHRDYTEQHSAARKIRTEGEYKHTAGMDDRWAACEACANIIDHRDIPRLITRVMEPMPSKLKKGNNLRRIRGQLDLLYQDLFKNLKSKRKIIRGE